ncbi:MAG: NAD-dependent malic enzyme [Syntrophobacterales bacterium]|nr:NAD-dependent malic enzyme [Syntrophobacterales bacterium]
MTDIEKYSYKITRKIRVRIPDVPGAFGQMATELGKHGAVLGDITKVHLTSQYITRDIIIFFDDEKQFSDTISDLKQLKNYKLISIEDEVLHIHRGGKIAIMPTVKIDTLSDLRMVYTPGVAQMCNHIVEHPEAAREYTSIGNSACIATNGSAVLGLGNIGVLAGMPVMEGKSVILNKMAGVSCMPLLIESDNADRIVDTLEAVSKTFSIIMIEDIKAPLCFEVEERLQERVPIPVFHDDQHGTATVILAALLKALQFVDKQKERVKIVISGVGAAGMATGKMLLEYGFRHITVCDRKGALYMGRPEHMNAYKNSIAELTNKTGEKGGLKEVMREKDIFIGVSSSNLVSKDMVRSMNNAPIIFALANPLPEIHLGDALEAGAGIALDGRTINNCLVFPGIIRGTLDSGAPRITYPMKFSAAETLASLAGKHEIIPDFMNPGVHKKIADAVRQATL